jgi:hypothetical protein
MAYRKLLVSTNTFAFIQFLTRNAQDQAEPFFTVRNNSIMLVRAAASRTSSGWV